MIWYSHDQMEGGQFIVCEKIVNYAVVYMTKKEYSLLFGNAIYSISNAKF